MAPKELIVGSILIAKDMVVLLACNRQQSQDTNTQITVSKNRIVLDDSPNSVLLERRAEMREVQAIPLVLRSSDSEWTSREVGTAFSMAGASYLS